MQRLRWALASAAAAVLLSGCGLDGYRVRYEVIGSGTTSASLTYATADGGTAQRDATLPATIEMDDVEKDTFLYISAQNNARSGTITVRILVDGNVWKSTSSSGAFVIATASGSCC